MRQFILFVFTLLTTVVMWGQITPATGDYRTNTATVDWNTAANWDKYDGANWATSSTIPGATDNVFIQSGHTATLTAETGVNNLYMCNNTTTATTGTVRGVIACATYALDVNGVMKSYWGAVGTGTAALPVATPLASVTLPPFTITAASAGEVKIVGNTRTLCNTGEWAAISGTSSTTSAPIEIALNANQTVTLLTNIKAAGWTFTSGTTSGLTFSVDNGTTGTGNITVSNGATFISTVGTSNAFQRSANATGGTLTVASGGTLKFTGSAPKIQMTAIAFNGTVEYSGTGQTLAGHGSGSTTGVDPTTYTNLVLSNSGVKTLYINTTVNGTLSMNGTATLALGAFTLTYGASSTLTYGGTAIQTTGVELPSSSGPTNLTINNSNGVTLGGPFSISGTLTIATGVVANLGTYVSTANTLSLGGVGQTSTGTWGATGSGATNINDTYFAGTGTVNVSTPLPVEMTSFTAVAQKMSALLKWRTATEVNNYGFNIERRAIASSAWAKVGFVAGNGTSNAAHNYTYADNNLSAGVYAYRIKQIDNDGTFKYSASTEVTIAGVPKELKLFGNYPNPFNPSTKVEFTVPENGNVHLSVYNILGQEVATLFNGAAEAGNLYTMNFDASRMASGLYFSVLEFGNQHIAYKMLLTK